MESNGTEAGIYLVVWLKKEQHDKPANFKSIDDLRGAIERNKS
jgi:hypothetical protein